MHIDFKQFSREFYDCYDFLYEHPYVDMTPYLDEYDKEVKTNQRFHDVLCDFSAYRCDYVTSDREVAAFVMAYHSI